MNPCKLIIKTPPCRHIFPGRRFPLEIQLVNQDGRPLQPTCDFHISLHDENGAYLRHEQNLLIVTGPQRFEKKETACVYISFSQKAVGRFFTLKIFTRGNSSNFEFDEVLTHSVAVVTHMLKILTQPVTKFYKDGPRANAVSFVVQLVDQNDTGVRCRKLPLRLTLLYADDHSVVENQRILKIVGETRTSSNQCHYFLDPTKGERRFEYRLEEVSKTHRDREFAVKVDAQPDPQIELELGIIGAAVTSGTRVYSKPPEKQRGALMRKRKIENLYPSQPSSSSSSGACAPSSYCQCCSKLLAQNNQLEEKVANLTNIAARTMQMCYKTLEIVKALHQDKKQKRLYPEPQSSPIFSQIADTNSLGAFSMFNPLPVANPVSVIKPEYPSDVILAQAVKPAGVKPVGRSPRIVSTADVGSLNLTNPALISTSARSPQPSTPSTPSSFFINDTSQLATQLVRNTSNFELDARSHDPSLATFHNSGRFLHD